MDKNYVCVGGIEQIGGRHIRPVTAGMRLVRKLIESEGGPFGIGFVVDIGDTRPCGIAPLVEDVEFRPATLALSGDSTKAPFFACFTLLRKTDLGVSLGMIWKALPAV